MLVLFSSTAKLTSIQRTQYQSNAQLQI